MEDLEIERKFQVVQGWKIPENSRRAHIRQAYLSAPEADVEVRIRAVDLTFLMTVKAPSAEYDGTVNVRTEVEFPISGEDFLRLWKLTTDRLEKDRWSVPLGEAGDGPEAVVDVYEGTHEGLRVVEVEFEDLEQAKAFRLPHWFGPEVTGLREWGNRYLSRSHSRP